MFFLRRHINLSLPELLICFAFVMSLFFIEKAILKNRRSKKRKQIAMKEIEQIETENNISLPELYRAFYYRCSFSAPLKLVGTDLRNRNPELNKWALELLKEDRLKNFLDKDDFVFMMHQGYIFWYFKANGDSDPIVFGYHEGRSKPDNLGPISIFLKEYML